MFTGMGFPPTEKLCSVNSVVVMSFAAIADMYRYGGSASTVALMNLFKKNALLARKK